MSVNIEGNVGQTSVASGWYQNGRAVYFTKLTVTPDDERHGSRCTRSGQSPTNMWNWRHGFIFRRKRQGGRAVAQPFRPVRLFAVTVL